MECAGYYHTNRKCFQHHSWYVPPHGNLILMPVTWIPTLWRLIIMVKCLMCQYCPPSIDMKCMYVGSVYSLGEQSVQHNFYSFVVVSRWQNMKWNWFNLLPFYFIILETWYSNMKGDKTVKLVILQNSDITSPFVFIYLMITMPLFSNAQWVITLRIVGYLDLIHHVVF